ncbi:MAG: hypothetical protein RIS35_4 [Pseudomonadota bacterium]|jgi:hypothetical protein
MTPPFNVDPSFTELQKRMFAPFIGFNTLALRTFERAARETYAAAGEALEFGIAQARAITEAQDPQALVVRQSQLATDFMNRQATRSNEWLKIAAEAQADAGKWAQAANDEWAAAARRSA